MKFDFNRLDMYKPCLDDGFSIELVDCNLYYVLGLLENGKYIFEICDVVKGTEKVVEELGWVDFKEAVAKMMLD
ncbi:MAG: hypothetical protein ACRCZ0_10005 [Cetobacterium sp.]